MRRDIIWGAWISAGLLAACSHSGGGADAGADSALGSFIPESAFGDFIPSGFLTIPPIHTESPPPELGCECTPTDCIRPTCAGEMCVGEELDDDSPCTDFGICVAGSCEQLEECDEPEVLSVVASSAFVEAHSAGPSASAAADDTGRVLVIWSAVEGRQIVLYGRRYLADGAPVDCSESPIEINRVAALGWDLEPTVVGLESGWVVAWTAPDGDGDLGAIALQAVTAGGRLLTPTRQANVQPYFHQHSPALARLNDGFVVAWVDDSGLDPTDEGTSVRARRFDADGGALDEDEIVVSSRRTGDQLQPAIAAIDSTWVVVWTDTPLGIGQGPGLWGRRFMGAAPVDTADLEIDLKAATSPSLAILDEETFGLAFETRVSSSRGDVLVGSIPVGEGMLGEIDELMDDAQLAELRPSIAPIPGGFVVASEVGESASDTRRNVSLAAIGGSLPGGATELTSLLSGDGMQRDASLMTAGDALWVVWSDDGTQWGDMMDPVEGDPDAYRSVLLYRLELGGGP